MGDKIGRLNQMGSLPFDATNRNERIGHRQTLGAGHRLTEPRRSQPRLQRKQRRHWWRRFRRLGTRRDRWWSTPAVEPTISWREGRRQRRSEGIGVGSTQRSARTDWAWRERKEWDGSVESSGSSKRKWLSKRSRKPEDGAPEQEVAPLPLVFLLRLVFVVR